jgi:hypothetical protein
MRIDLIFNASGSATKEILKIKAKASKKSMGRLLDDLV